MSRDREAREVLIVGAGPAGLAAAAAALDAGARVTIADSSDSTGGQYWRHLPASRFTPRERQLHHGWSRYEQLRDRLDDPDCTLLLDAQVWSIEPDDDSRCGLRLNVSQGPADASGARLTVHRPDSLVLATGAHDRTLPFPGWQLPGVFTGGAAQALAKGDRVRIGERVIVAGAGPFLLPVATSVAGTGARVVEVAEASGAGRFVSAWAARPWQLLGAASKVGELIGYIAGFVRHRIRYRTATAVIAVHGESRVEAVTLAKLDGDWRPRPGTERRVAVDAVCVTHGFTPRLELAIAAGCELGDRRFVTVDDRQQTSAPGVFAAGEITGIGGVDLALAEGKIAGAAAAGAPPAGDALRSRRAFMQFAGRIDRGHAPRAGWRQWMRPDTIVCRCEEVDYAALSEAAIVTGARGLRPHKLVTRAGLGLCQARVCGRTVEELSGCDFLDRVSTDRRPISSPQRLGDLARSLTRPEP